MVISELALGLFTNLLYDSFKNIPEYISDTSSKVYEKAIEEFSNKNYKLTGIQIDTFFRQENVEKAITKYLKNPNKLDCSNILIHEFFELFSEEDFSREDADLILNSFFEIIDAEIEKEPELRDYLILNFVKRTDKTTQEINQGVKELSQDVKEISHNVQEMKEVINGGRENQDKKEPGVDFEKSLEKYLNKIIDDNENKEINEIYTELSAKEILPVTLKFRETESDIPREYEVLELVEKEEKLIISGESGSGKTTTLRWLNYILAKSYFEGKNENIPLYVELNSYINEERFIKEPFDAYVAMKAKKNGISENTLETILKEKAIILLDGFDLLSPTDEFYPYEKISNFITDYNNCRFVISSRPGFFESIKSFKVSELEKLTDEKIEIFINRYVSSEELADTLKDEILSNEQLKSILSTPMMLYIAIKVSMERKDQLDDLLPSNRSELYEAFISTLFSHQGEKGKHLCADRIQIENALTDLYFTLQCRNEVSCKYPESLKFVKKSSEDHIFKKISPQLILEDCFKLGILYKNDNYVSYGIHQSFQEYFAAIKLKELFESGYDVSEVFSHPKWEEVVIFTSEMLDSDLLNEYIDLMISKGELFLASKCANNASDKEKEKLCALLADKMNSKFNLEKINSIEGLGRIGIAGINILAKALRVEDRHEQRHVIKALGSIQSEKVVNPLVEVLKIEEEFARKHAVDALGNVKSEKAVQLLIEVLKDEDRNLRWEEAETLGNIKYENAENPQIEDQRDEDANVQRYRAKAMLRREVAKALGNIKSYKAVNPLIEALKDEDRNVRIYITEALGNIKSDKAVNPLIEALKDEDSDVRWRAAEALGNIKSDKAVNPLIEALKDGYRCVRWEAAGALGDIKSDKAVNPLIEALRDEDSNVRWFVAKALGDIKSDKAVNPLIESLKDKHKLVRLLVIEALGNIKSEKAVNPLFEAFKDKDEQVHLYVATALENLKLEKSEQLLIEALKDENSSVRRNAAHALGNIKSEKAVNPLIEALKDEIIIVKNIAAESLGKIKSDKAVNPLIEALRDEVDSERWYVRNALGNIKSEKSEQLLIEALKDENSSVRRNVAEALGDIKSEKAVNPLIETLKDEDKNVRRYAAKALGDIKSERAVNPLIVALKDEDETVRRNVAKALGNINNVKSETSEQQLIEALRDKDSEVRSYVAVALGNIRSDKAVNPLIESLKDKDRKVRWDVAVALGNIKSDKAVNPLIEALKNGDETERWIMAKALGEICTVKNKECLENLLESENEFLVNTAFKILFEIEKEQRSKIVLFKDEEKFLKT